MAYPLMPKAVVVWLVDNTTLTFEQVSNFCGLHILEVQAIADGEVATGMLGLDPIIAGELTREEIIRCEEDTNATLKISVSNIPQARATQKGARYTPVSKRQDRPNAISWLIKNYPELSDPQISKLVGTTKPTINAIRDRTHWNTTNIKPMNPVGLGLCNGDMLEKAVAIARAKAGTTHVPGAATAPDGVHSKEPIEPEGELYTAPSDEKSLFGTETPRASASKSEDEDAPTADSLFGPAKTDD